MGKRDKQIDHSNVMISNGLLRPNDGVWSLAVSLFYQRIVR